MDQNDFGIIMDEHGRPRLFVNGKELHHVTGYEIKQDATDGDAHVKLEFDARGAIDISLYIPKSSAEARPNNE